MASNCLIDRLIWSACTLRFMQIEWNRQQEADGRPVYLQIAEAVRAAIARSGLGSGARLPAIRDLARELGVHRDTVATAYEALAADGVIESAVGRGTFVADGEAGRSARRPRRSRPRSRRWSSGCSSSSARGRASAARATRSRCTR